MRVLILHNEVAAGASSLERDVLDQVAAVAGALSDLGHRADVLGCNLDLATLDRELARRPPDLVFNLVESLGGCDRLLPLVPELLEARGIPFTGSSSSALRRSGHKAEAKQELSAAGIPTPPTLARWPDGTPAGETPSTPRRVPVGERWIVKSLWEHGSRGLDDDAILDAGTVVRDALERRSKRLGCELLAEPYLEGRELNLSLLAGSGDVEVLPPAEIEFVGFPAGKPRIVGHAAKWAEGSFEERHTPRRFDFEPRDQPLLDLLAEIARRCWSVLGLRGWARVDFRVDPDGRPWVLEVNANPCLAPDAGFQAALARAGIGFERAIERICGAALDPGAGSHPARRATVVISPGG